MMEDSKIGDPPEKQLEEGGGGGGNGDHFSYKLATCFNKASSFDASFSSETQPKVFVVLGGQSAGKSSLLEACIGFECNYISSGIATKRPLMLQLVKSANAHAPKCRFVDEKTGQLGDQLYSPEQVKQEIESRSRGIDENSISHEPLVLNIEFVHATTMNIFDIPGFRAKLEKEDDMKGISKDIENLARSLINNHPSRHIIFVEQSTSGFANSRWLDLVKELDPKFSRTTFVMSKMDAKVDALSRDGGDTADVVNRFLACEGFLASSTKVFFVSMPKMRGIPVRNYPSELKKANAELVNNLSRLSMDDKFLERVGIQRFLDFICNLAFEENLKNVGKSIRAMRNRIGVLEREIGKEEERLKLAETLPKNVFFEVLLKMRTMGEALMSDAPHPELAPSIRKILREEFGQSAEQEMGGEEAAAADDLRLFGNPQLKRICDTLKGSFELIYCISQRVGAEL